MSRDLRECLEARRTEIEEAILIRTHLIDDPNEVGDPEYVQGLKEAIRTALDYAISALEGDGPRPDSVPPQLLAQARVAARNGVTLDTVLRRYLTGYTLFCDYLVQEAREGAKLQRALRAQTALLDQIVVAITDAYKSENDHHRRPVERRQAERVKKLLEGNPIDAVELGYELNGWHLGVVAHGPGASHALREHAAALDRRLLLVRPGGMAVWGWFGAERRTAVADLAVRASADSRAGAPLAIGEPGRGIAGWRLTHLQAKAALPVALRGESRVVSYSDVAILASALGDEVLTTSLIELYLAPLATERDGGAALRDTLAAYLASGRNASATAAALGVSRNTVSARLRAAEEKVGRPLEECSAELQTALRLRELGKRQADVPRPT